MSHALRRCRLWLAIKPVHMLSKRKTRVPSCFVEIAGGHKLFPTKWQLTNRNLVIWGCRPKLDFAKHDCELNIKGAGQPRVVELEI